MCRVGRFLPQFIHGPQNRTSGTPVATPFPNDGAFARIALQLEPPRLFPPRVREDHTMSTTRSAFHQQVIAPSGSAPSFIDPATLPPRSESRRRFARLAPLPKFPQGWLVLCDLGSRPRKSTLLLVRDAVRLRFSEPRRRPPTSAIDDDARTRRAYGSSSPVNAALGRFALPCREVTQTTGSEPRVALFRR